MKLTDALLTTLVKKAIGINGDKFEAKITMPDNGMIVEIKAEKVTIKVSSKEEP